MERKRGLFRPANALQKAIGRIVVMADSAHAFGARWRGQMVGNVADFSCFSFHAVKNFTTAEGGCVTWRQIEGVHHSPFQRSPPEHLSALALHLHDRLQMLKPYRYKRIAEVEVEFMGRMTVIHLGIEMVENEESSPHRLSGNSGRHSPAHRSIPHIFFPVPSCVIRLLSSLNAIRIWRVW